MREKLFPRLRFDTQYLWFSFMLNGRKFLHYSFRMDYSRYQLHFFPYNAIHPQQSTQKGKETSEQSKIGKSDLTEILPNPSSNNKLLVFVMRIDDGLALEKAWKAKGVNAVFLDRTSKFSPDSMGSSEITEEFSGTNEQKEQKHTVWKKLLRDERFDADVLISTSFLDTGINIPEGVTEIGNKGGIFINKEPTLLVILPFDEYYNFKYHILKYDSKAFIAAHDCYAIQNGYSRKILPF